MKKILTGLLAGVLLLPLAACGSGKSSASASGAAKTKVTLGYTADFAGAAAYAVATAQGYWAKEGLDPTLKVFTNGPLQIQALGAGSLDFGYVGPGALWLPASGKAQVIAVNMLGMADRVIAQPGSGISTAADLKGHKVAVPAGTSGDMILNLALQQAGLTAKDITEVPMDPSTVVTAFSAKQIDAAAIWYPLIDTIKKRDPNLVEVAGEADYYPKLTFPSAFVTQPDMETKNAALVTKVTKVLRESEDWIAAHPDQAEQQTATFLKLPQAQLAGSTQYVKILTSADLDKLTADGTVDGWFNGLASVFVQMGKLKAPGDAKSYYLGGQYQAAKN